MKLSGEDGGTCTYKVKRFEVYFVVFRIAKLVASCSCKMSDFEGILRKHVLAIFKATNVFTLPVLHLKAKNGKEEVILDLGTELQGSSQKSMKMQYNILYKEAIIWTRYFRWH